MSELVSMTKEGDIAVIAINNPPVNALSPGVPEGIEQSLQAIRDDASIKGAVLIGEGTTFIAGADIKEFGKITSGEKKSGIGLNPVLQLIEQFPKPVVCAIHGTALGGGLETAMACHYRVAVPTAKVGQPEVKLGIIPGAGGTQRLPRLVGVPKAAELCAIGNPISAKEAHQAGLIDEIIEGDLRQGAIEFARKLAGKTRQTRNLTDKLGTPEKNAAALDELKKTIAARSRGVQAPLKAIEAVEVSAKLPFDEGLEREREIFDECLFSTQSKALIHVFFGERIVGKIPDIPKDIKPLEIKQAAIVGAGTMGGGITMNYVNAGIPVMLREATQDQLDKGLATIRRNYEISQKKGRMTEADVEQRMSLITPTLTYDGFEKADIIVEAVFESMELKKKVFAELDKVARDGAILASNTSTLNIDEIASATKRPEMVIGHHFFSPANVMKLLEIVRGEKTSKPVIATSMALAKKIGKVGILVGNCYGFVGNRMFEPYVNEANFLLEEGARVEDVDAALVEFGMAMGPLAVQDLAGIDVGWRIRQEARHLVPKGHREPVVMDKLYELNRFGQKTGSGWYRYEGRTPVPDPEVQKLIEDSAKEAGIARRKISKEEILERTLYILINEGAQILEEGYALRAVDIDIAYVYGYGFPAHRGGPMFYADTVGLKKIYDTVCRFEKEIGPWWTPSPLLKRLAESGKTFADFDAEK